MKKALGLTMFLAVTLMVSAAFAEAPFADGVYVPPAGKAAVTGLPADQLAEWVGAVQQYHTFTVFEGQNESLKQQSAAAKSGPLRGGEVVAVDMPEGELFGEPVQDGEMWLHLASITSVDAEAIRLRVDLSGLAPGEEVWVIDPEAGCAFGPVTGGSGDEAGQWLATVHGEEAVLAVRSPYAETPDVQLVAFSHVYLSFKYILKELSCNIDIACETDEDIQEASAGVGMIFVSGQWFCSGTLVNNAKTADTLEPFFLTANHCICSGEQARGTEVYWDYRSSQCDVDDSPSPSTLPRSKGDALLATEPYLDTTLIRLDSVPSGDYGRSYLGWDSSTPSVGTDILAIHHPQATRMRISYGKVTEVNQSENGNQDQTRVLWDEGVTEGGSSGSALLVASTLRIIGMLSQGPQHSCGEDRSGNYDLFGSFPAFYPMVKDYLDTATPSTAAGSDDCTDPTEPTGLCPFKVSYGDQPEMLSAFRALRDDVLKKSAAGQMFVAGYYRVAPRLAETVAASPDARKTFVAVTAPFARLGMAARER